MIARKITIILGLVILVLAGLLIAREQFGWDIFPFRDAIERDDKERNIRLDGLFGYKQLPQIYTIGENISMEARFVNEADVSLADSYTIRVYKVLAIWDTLNRDINYDARERGSVVAGDIFTENELLEMVGEIECERDTCYTDVNPADNNRQYGGLEVDYDMSMYENVFDVAIPAEGELEQNLEFMVGDCGYYMAVIGNEQYWATQQAGEGKVTFFGVGGCDVGEIASGVMDVRDLPVEEPAEPVPPEPVEELPVAGPTEMLYGLILIGYGLMVRGVWLRV